MLKSGLDNLKELLKPDVKPDADVFESKQPLKKGRGKSKKAALNRVSFTFLADSSDIERLDKLALSQDVSVAHLVRLAIKSYLKKAD